jgi:hypothetical protein
MLTGAEYEVMILRVVIHFRVFQRPATPARHTRGHKEDRFSIDGHGTPTVDERRHVNDHNLRISETPALTGFIKGGADEPTTDTAPPAFSWKSLVTHK